MLRRSTATIPYRARVERLFAFFPVLEDPPQLPSYSHLMHYLLKEYICLLVSAGFPASMNSAVATTILEDVAVQKSAVRNIAAELS